MKVLVGTAGFSYRDWKCTFYPPDIDSRRMLEEYALHFPVVEINSTYYAIPPAARINAMAQRTPPNFEFTVKANREMTHEISADPSIAGNAPVSSAAFSAEFVRSTDPFVTPLA